MRRGLWLGSILVAACHGDDPPPTDLLDTGWFTTTPSTCTGEFTAWIPAADTADWSWRAAPVAVVSEPGPEPYRAWIEDSLGATVPSTLVWGSDELSVTVSPDAPLAPSSDFELVLVDCVRSQRIPFSTSAYGLPLTDGPGSLVGSTWLVDLATATWVEPVGLGLLFATYLDTPMLLGVTYADDQHIDVLAAQGILVGGSVTQDPAQDVWAFPTSDFTDAPFFSVTAPRIVLVVPDEEAGPVEAPVENFHFEGTFSADASSLGGVEVTGMADTRTLGPLLNKGDDPNAACDAVEELGAVCVSCVVDGGPYCIPIRGVDLEGVLVPGLVLQASP